MASTPSPHLVLARKWRPERFSELVGQEHVTRTLVQALKSGRIAHAFLFTGIRGVGKTTAARILARCLDCAEGPTPEPCGKCAACLEIRAGASLDVVEIDGATYRKIDDARAIIENLGYRPARDRFKIYIIDEAHQLTDQAFNALLKTLEEPPAHVKFILATTEPQKMPETILSRLQRYDFRRLPFAVILARLRELAGREEIKVDEAALTLLAREAGGSMRDAERMLETAIASLGGEVAEGEVAALLGVASRTRVLALAEAILEKDAASALATVRDLNHRGANLEALGRDMLELLRNLAVAKLPGTNGPKSPLADLPDQEAAEVRKIAGRASLRDLMRLFRLMGDAQEQLIRSPYPDLMLEMTMIRMATLAPVLDADELMKAIGTAGSGGGGSSAAAKPPATSATPAASAPSSGASASRRESALEPPAPGVRRIPIQGEVKAEAPRRSAVVPASAPAPSTTAAGASNDLPDLRDFIRGRRAALAGFMEQGAGLVLEGDGLTVTPRSDIYVRYLSDNRNVIADLATELYGRRIKVVIGSMGESPASPPATASPVTVSPAAQASVTTPAAGEANGVEVPPAPVPSPAAAQTPAEARQTLYADPVVRRIFEEFEARLVEIKTTPSTAAAPDKK
ncbi:MAG TPA: DNA polymerase III subunit gamma/tau [Candidatus Binataceae bacterium]|nr:DNA polymerase III subunit gamma/tau [Candidatus Binataceae bacterium]